MKILEIKDSCGYFRDGKGNFVPMDKLTKEDLLRLANWTLQENVVEFDPYEEQAIQNQAHQIIYKNISQKLVSLRARREEFIDESARLYLEDYQKYREDSRKPEAGAA